MTPLDLAALAQTAYLALDDLDGFNGAAYLRGKFAEVATFSRTAGLEEAAKVCDGYARDNRMYKEHACETSDELASEIRALASDPGEQVAEDAVSLARRAVAELPSNAWASIIGKAYLTTPAHPTEPGEIERLREALECARIKLSRYQEQHGGNYIGGVWSDGIRVDHQAHRRRPLHPESCTAERTDAMTIEQIATFLFDLLDDIDTAGDMAKSDDAAFRAIVERLHRRRFEVASTDGYSLTFKGLTP